MSTIPAKIPVVAGATTPEPATSKVSVSMTATEKATLTARAKKAGLSLSAYSRKRLTQP